jgi:predicted alpha/beta superfamily hydrolase
MKSLFILLVSMVMMFGCAQKKNDNVIIGKVDSIYSKAIKEQRKFWVYVPNSDPDDLYSKQHYPVVYLLDGDAHFYSVMGMIQQLSQVNGNTICPEMIVVGIPNTDRTRDLTPTHVAGIGADTSFMKTSGGGKNFMAFIEKELIPYIDSTYPTAPYRMIIGHSFGGLTAVNALINHTQLFNAYVAIDPSLWWDDQKLLTESMTVLKQPKFAGKYLFLGIANTMKPGMDTLQVKADTSGGTKHIRSILQFANLLKQNPANGLKSDYKYYPQDNHGSVPLISEYDALRFIFRDYNIPFGNELYDSAFNADSALNAHYQLVSAQMGYRVLPPEVLINSLGYNFLQSKLFDKAYTFFKMNMDNYPGSFNVYDSMGDYYKEKGDKEKALQFFNKALAIRDFPATREKVDKLKAK